MLECNLCSLPAELLLFRGWGGGEEKCKIKAKLSPAKARAEVGNNYSSLCFNVEFINM